MAASLLVVILMALSASANNSINKQCQSYNDKKIVCSCIGNEELSLPDEFNYTSIVSVTITSCKSVNLHYSSLPEATGLKEIIIQNISDNLDFDVYITSSRMNIIKLTDIGCIPSIVSDTFISMHSLDMLIIENTHINNFEENFSDVSVSRFIMRNVTIDRVDQMNLAEHCKILRIMDSEWRNITTSLTFNNIQKVEIINSKFKLQNSNLISILSDNMLIRNSVFLDASMNFNAAFATIHGICADGKSTLRLSSKSIDSINNRLPSQIIYPKQNNQSLRNESNIVCKAGNCNCPKISGQAPCSTSVSLLVVGSLLTSLCFDRFRLRILHCVFPR